MAVETKYLWKKLKKLWLTSVFRKKETFTNVMRK